jgi:hypothetical protein
MFKKFASVLVVTALFLSMGVSFPEGVSAEQSYCTYVDYYNNGNFIIATVLCPTYNMALDYRHAAHGAGWRCFYDPEEVPSGWLLDCEYIIN